MQGSYKMATESDNTRRMSSVSMGVPLEGDASLSFKQSQSQQTSSISNKLEKASSLYQMHSSTSCRTPSIPTLPSTLPTRAPETNALWSSKWSGKVALVTGGTSGIGIETGVALHATSADLYFTARDLKNGDATSSEILRRTTGKGKLEVIQLDLDSLDSVRHAAKDFLAKSSTLNILINNAGTQFLVPFPLLRATP